MTHYFLCAPQSIFCLTKLIKLCINSLLSLFHNPMNTLSSCSFLQPASTSCWALKHFMIKKKKKQWSENCRSCKILERQQHFREVSVWPGWKSLLGFHQSSAHPKLLESVYPDTGWMPYFGTVCKLIQCVFFYVSQKGSTSSLKIWAEMQLY